MKFSDPYKFLTIDVSTIHVSQNDVKLIDKSGESDDLCVYNYEFGYLITVPEDETTFKDTLKILENKGYTKEFIEIFKACHQHKAHYLQLDCDGQEYDDLKKFDW